MSNWKPGDKISSPVSEMITLDMGAISAQDRYRLIIGAVVPRPIAFVSTKSKAGKGNLAPFSFFNGVCSNPPCLMFSIARKPDGSKKDTLLNIEETGEFVINTASVWIAEPLVHCAATYPYGVDEMEKSGLTPVPSTKIKPLRVKEAPIHFECETYKIVDIGDGSPGSSAIVVGKILVTHIAKEAYSNGKINSKILEPLSRLGGISYAGIGESFDIQIPDITAKK